MTAAANSTGGTGTGGCATSNVVLYDNLAYGTSSDGPSANCAFHVGDDGWLTISNKNLVRIDAKELPSDAVTCDFSRNQLTTFPAIKAEGLLHLYLDYNPIKAFEDIVLPDTLLDLSVNGTMIKKISNVKFPRNMNQLDISETEIVSMHNIDAPALSSFGLTNMSVPSLELRNFDFPSRPMSIYIRGNPNVDFHGAIFPAGSAMYLERNELDSIVGIPFPRNMKEVALSDNKFKAFPQFPANQSKIERIFIGTNRITTLANVSLPPNLKELYVDNNQIPDIRGITFPDTLMILDLDRNPLTYLEITQTNFDNWNLDNSRFQLYGNPDVKRCENGADLRMLRAKFKVCVLNDDKWNKLYPQTFEWKRDDASGSSNSIVKPDNGPSSGGAHTTSGSSSTGSTIGIIAGCLVAVVALVGFFIWKRNKRERDDSMLGESLNSHPKHTRTNTIEDVDIDEMSSHQLVSGSIHDTIGADPVILAAKIPLSLIEEQTLLGRGGTGEVYKGLYKDQVVAIKRLKAEHRKSMEHIKMLMAEVKLMAGMEHPNIVGFVGVAWDALADLTMVMEYMNGGNLRTLLGKFQQDKRPQGLDRPKLRIAECIANGLTYLHSLTPKVVHRDLKSSNILLNDQQDAKLVDFGISRERIEQTMTAGVGTSLWMAPEVMMGRRYDEKADIYSFGVVLSELDTHEYPFAAFKRDDRGRPVSEAALLQQVALGKIRAQFSKQTPMEVVDLASCCLSLNPTERPTAAELVYRLRVLSRERQQNFSDLLY